MIERCDFMIRLFVIASVHVSMLIFTVRKLKLNKLYLRKPYAFGEHSNLIAYQSRSSQLKLLIRTNDEQDGGEDRSLEMNKMASQVSLEREIGQDRSYSWSLKFVEATSRFCEPSLAYRVYVKISTTYYLIMFVKYVIRYSLELDCLKSYRWLDCYLLGRLSLTARTVDTGLFSASYFTLLQIIWRYSNLIRETPIRLECLEFLTFSYEEIQTEETKHLDKLWTNKHDAHSDLDWMHHDTQYEKSRKQRGQKKATSFNSIFYLRESPLSLDRSDEFIYRPNRTTKTYKTVARASIVYVMVCCVTFIPILLLVGYMILPMITTENGFEICYHRCVKWIRQLPESEQPNYSHIYPILTNETSLPKVIIISSPLVPPSEYRRVNLYQFLKVAFDCLDNLILWVDFCSMYVSNQYIALIILLDILLYASEIKSRLEKIIDKLKQVQWTLQEQSTSLTLKQQLEEQHNSKTLLYDDDLEIQIDKTQKMIVDLFSFVVKYNNHASMFTLSWLCTWLCYNVVVCSYVYSAVDPSEVYEYYLVQTAAIITVCIIICTYGIVSITLRRLYKQISVVMALDRDWHSTKARWSILMKLYFPIELSSFSIFGMASITVLFCLKLLAWAFSATLVVASFFTFYRHQKS